MPNISGSPVSDLSADAWPNHYNQPYQSFLPVREGVPILTVQTPDAKYPAVLSDIYSPLSPWDVPQKKFHSLEEEGYDLSMPDSDNYPSPASEGSGGRSHFKDTSPVRDRVVMNVNNSDQTSPSSGGSTVREKLSRKRDEEPPKNEGGQITCTHQDCSRGTPPTFQRKCEWRSVFQSSLSAPQQAS